MLNLQIRELIDHIGGNHGRNCHCISTAGGKRAIQFFMNRLVHGDQSSVFPLALPKVSGDALRHLESSKLCFHILPQEFFPANNSAEPRTGLARVAWEVLALQGQENYQ